MANSASKDPKTGKWYVQFRYTDWTGETKKTTKRGFDTKREAEEWLRNFLTAKAADVDMLFGSLVELYFEDLGTRLREYTLRNKHYLIDGKILPYFKDKSVSSITPADIRKWQAEMLSKGYKDVFLANCSKGIRQERQRLKYGFENFIHKSKFWNTLTAGQQAEYKAWHREFTERSAELLRRLDKGENVEEELKRYLKAVESEKLKFENNAKFRE